MVKFVGENAKHSRARGADTWEPVIPGNRTGRAIGHLQVIGHYPGHHPTIRRDSIELNILQQLSNFIPTTNGVNNSPTLIKRELSSIVNFQDNDIIVMGGLEETTKIKALSGFKLLPQFLKNNTDNNSKSDILLVLHVTRL